MRRPRRVVARALGVRLHLAGVQGSPAARVESSRTRRTTCGPHAVAPAGTQPRARVDGARPSADSPRAGRLMYTLSAPCGAFGASSSPLRQPARPAASATAHNEAVPLRSTRLWTVTCADRASRCSHRRRRLSRPQRGHPRDRAQGRSTSTATRCRLPRRLARAARERIRASSRRVDARHPAPRRHHPRHLPHQPLQARRRRRPDAARHRVAGPRRPDRDRRRGHARGRRQAAAERPADRRRAEDHRQRPRRPPT